jgi:hypothetical protein
MLRGTTTGTSFPGKWSWIKLIHSSLATHTGVNWRDPHETESLRPIVLRNSAHQGSAAACTTRWASIARKYVDLAKHFAEAWAAGKEEARRRAEQEVT